MLKSILGEFALRAEKGYGHEKDNNDDDNDENGNDTNTLDVYIEEIIKLLSFSLSTSSSITLDISKVFAQVSCLVSRITATLAIKCAQKQHYTHMNTEGKEEDEYQNSSLAKRLAYCSLKAATTCAAPWLSFISLNLKHPTSGASSISIPPSTSTESQSSVQDFSNQHTASLYGSLWRLATELESTMLTNTTLYHAGSGYVVTNAQVVLTLRSAAIQVTLVASSSLITTPFTISDENFVMKSKLTSKGIAFDREYARDAKLILAIITTISAVANDIVCGDILYSLSWTKSSIIKGGNDTGNPITIK
jgi:hypothetical protein